MLFQLFDFSFSWIPAAIAAAGTVAGGLLGKSSAQQQAKMSMAEAQRNRDFQERMSSTAYQRSAADLEKAGLNRVLALGSPASSPGGTVASFPDMAGAVSSGAQAGGTAAERILNARLNAAQVSSAQSAARMAENEADLSDQKKVLETKKFQYLLKAAEKGEGFILDELSQGGLGGLGNSLLETGKSSAKWLWQHSPHKAILDTLVEGYQELKEKAAEQRRGRKMLTIDIKKGNDGVK